MKLKIKWKGKKVQNPLKNVPPVEKGVKIDCFLTLWCVSVQPFHLHDSGFVDFDSLSLVCSICHGSCWPHHVLLMYESERVSLVSCFISFHHLHLLLSLIFSFSVPYISFSLSPYGFLSKWQQAPLFLPIKYVIYFGNRYKCEKLCRFSLSQVVSMGLYLGDRAYLRSSWNILDGFLVFVSLIDIVVSMAGGAKILGVLRVLRLLRTLRPLRYGGLTPSSCNNVPAVFIYVRKPRDIHSWCFTKLFVHKSMIQCNLLLYRQTRTCTIILSNYYWLNIQCCCYRKLINNFTIYNRGDYTLHLTII